MIATLQNRPLWQKLMLLFLLVGLIPMAVVGQRSVTDASEAMEAQVNDTLAGLRDAKAKSVRDYFDNRRREMKFLASAPKLVAGAQQLIEIFPRVAGENQADATQLSRYKDALRTYYVDEFGAEYKKRNQNAVDVTHALDLLSPQAITLQYLYIRANPHPLGSKHLLDNAGDASAYSRAHADTHEFLRNALTAFGYYDVFLIHPDTGDVVYTVFKELDYATNLLSGPWSKTNLATAFRKARHLKRGESVLVDFESYGPSYDDPASFMAAPVYANDTLVAIAVIQLPIEPMNAIMNDRSGLGETGESFLVGADRLMRSDSVFSEVHGIKTSFANPERGRVNGAAITAALEGRTGTIVDTHFGGKPVHAAFGSVDLADFKWAIMAVQNDTEALASIKVMERDNLIVATLSMVLVALAAWVLGRMVAKPIVALRNLIVTVQQTGEFQQPTLHASHDEVGQTVGAFENLMGVLKDAFSDANQVLAKVVNGEFTATQVTRYRGDIQRLAQGIDATVEQLRIGQEKQLQQQRDIEAAATAMKQKAEENEALARDAAEEADRANRVKQALDTCATPVMMTNNAREIVYANRSAERLASRLQSAFQSLLPGFHADRLLGTTLDALCRDLRQTYESSHATGGQELDIGGNTLRLTRSPITKDGTQVGEVAEWQDRTAEVAIERSIATLLAAASRGDFEVKVDERGMEGFYLDLSKGLNALVDTTRLALYDFKRVLGQMAQGDLTCRIDKHYSGTFGQLSNDVNATLDKISEVVEEITESANAIANGAAEIHSGVADLSRRTEQQAAALEETASSMDEMTASVKNSAQNASSVLDLSKQADEFARGGSEVVSRAVSSMEDISKASKEIADIIGVIDGIAFQTNLLALNAAVEAARAGEQGRGFAVVAAEVRMLAQRSAQAAKEIKGLISDSVTKVNTGHALVTESGRRLRDILSAVDRVSREVVAIASATKEQASGISQVNVAISAMDESTQQNSALVEQATAAAESMAGNARGMVQSVSFFRLRG